MATGTIFETQDGSHSIFSEEFGVSYHSRYGAIQESGHVFIEAGLYHKMLEQKEIRILEVGFGTGLNAFLTFLESEKHAAKIHYEAVEAFPITEQQAEQLNYPSLLGAEEHRDIFLAMHRLSWEEEHELSTFFSFRKVKKHFEDLNYEPAFDLIYFDAFAPGAQPHLWEEAVLGIMYKALKEKGVLVTYCAKGAVKRTFKTLGFQLEALPGPPGKREMTRCTKTSV